MTGYVAKHLNAERDLDEAAHYIQRQSGPDRAIRFLREADATFQLLARMPGLGALYEPDDPAFADLRMFPISRFQNYLIFYRPVADGIAVLRVLHGARDPQSLLAAEADAPEGEPRDEEPDAP